MSVPKYGTPDIASPSPSSSWASNVVNVVLMSPDQVPAPRRCIPAAPERQSIQARPSGRSRASPSAKARKRYRSKALCSSRALPRCIGAGPDGPSPPSSHQPATPSSTRCRCCSHHHSRASGFVKSMNRWFSAYPWRLMDRFPRVARRRRSGRCGRGIGHVEQEAAPLGLGVARARPGGAPGTRG